MPFPPRPCVSHDRTRLAPRGRGIAVLLRDQSDRVLMPSCESFSPDLASDLAGGQDWLPWFRACRRGAHSLWSGSKLIAASSDLAPVSSGDRLGGELYSCRIGPTTETNGDTIPSVYDVDHQRQFDPLLLGEVNLQRFVGARMSVPFGEPCQRLSPAERGTLTIGIARGLAPSRQQVDALLGFTVFARMHR